MENATAIYVVEFNNRKRLKELGFTDSMDGLDSYTAECFIEISKIIQTLEEQDMKARGNK